jgi:hypothetical protein
VLSSEVVEILKRFGGVGKLGGKLYVGRRVLGIAMNIWMIQAWVCIWMMIDLFEGLGMKMASCRFQNG